MNKILFTLILIGGLFAQDKELIKQLKSQDCAEFIELHSATYLSKETGLSEMYLLGNYHINLWQKPTSKGKGGKIAPTILPDAVKPYYDVMVNNRRNPNTISRYFKRACVKVGLPHYHFHHTRHSKASNTAMINPDLYYNKTLLRHDNVKTTEKYLKDTRLTWDKLVEGESFNA